MREEKNIAFYIAFPIGITLLFAFILFYFDLASGPSALFILALVNLVAFEDYRKPEK